MPRLRTTMLPPLSTLLVPVLVGYLGLEGVKAQITSNATCLSNWQGVRLPFFIGFGF